MDLGIVVIGFRGDRVSCFVKNYLDSLNVNLAKYEVNDSR